MSSIPETGWTLVCQIDDIPRLGARRVARAHAPAVAVFRNGADQVYALLDQCPHKGGPLSQGIVTDEGVVCPLHQWNIGLSDGCARAPDVGCTPRFVVQVIGSGVWLSTEELRSHGLPAVV